MGEKKYNSFIVFVHVLVILHSSKQSSEPELRQNTKKNRREKYWYLVYMFLSSGRIAPLCCPVSFSVNSPWPR